jgi:O-antigen/teichoic acid export membrane protein
MSNQYKQFGKHSIIFATGDILKSLIGFLLIPIYTRYLSPVDYGKLELLSITLTILVIFFSQGVSTAFFRSYAYTEKEMRKPLTYLVSTSYIYLFLSACVASALLFIFADEYNNFLFGKEYSSPVLIKIISITLLFQLTNTIPFQLFRAQLQSIKYIVVSLIAFTLQLVLNIYFITILKIGLEGILIANVISVFTTTGVTFLLIKKYLIFNISKDILKDLLSFGLPLIFAGIFIWIMQMSDRFLIQKLSSTHEVGLYSLGLRFSNILTILIVSPFNMVWGAIAFQISTKDEGKEVIRIVTTYIFLILCFVGINIIIWSPLIIKIMTGREFWEAHKVVTPLILATITWGLVNISDFGMYLKKRTKLMTGIFAVGALVNIILNYLLIPKYGMIAAAFAAFAAFVLINILCYLASQKYYYINFDFNRLFKIALIFITICIFSHIYQPANIILEISLRVFLSLLFIGSFFLFKFFEDYEIRYVKNIYMGFREYEGISNKVRYAYELLIK